MSNYLEKIFDNRPKELGDSSKKLYTRNLIKLNDGKQIEDLTFLKDIKKVKEMIKDYAPTTQRSYIIAACVVLSSQKDETLYNIYYKELSQMNNDLKNNTSKTETQKENWISQDEVEEVFNKLLSDAKKIKKPKNKTEYNKYLNLMVLAFFTQIAPRRPNDYAQLFIASNYDDKTKNYIDIENNKLIFNVYKTSKTYHEIIIDIPRELMMIVKMYVNVQPILKQKLKNKKYLNEFLLDNDNEGFNSNNITKLLNKIFNGNVSASLLRNIYLSSKYSKVIKELSDDTKNMSTSNDVALSNYIKKS
jgi:hypothetical protein